MSTIKIMNLKEEFFFINFIGHCIPRSINRVAVLTLFRLFLFSLSRAKITDIRDMALKSFIEVQPDSHFSIQNLPYGVFKTAPDSVQRPCVAIGEYLLNLAEIAAAGLFDGSLLKDSDCFDQVC